MRDLVDIEITNSTDSDNYTAIIETIIYNLKLPRARLRFVTFNRTAQLMENSKRLLQDTANQTAEDDGGPYSLLATQLGANESAMENMTVNQLAG